MGVDYRKKDDKHCRSHSIEKGFNNHSMVSTTGASTGEGEVYNSKEAVDSPPVTNISSEIQTSRLLRYKL